MRVTSWFLKIIVLLAVDIILQMRFHIGVFGVVLLVITAVVWAACSYVEVLANE